MAPDTFTFLSSEGVQLSSFHKREEEAEKVQKKIEQLERAFRTTVTVYYEFSQLKKEFIKEHNL